MSCHGGRSRLWPANLFGGCAGAVLATLVLAASALAGPPNHARDEGRDLAGFDHACGTAVDGEGNVYVSSAGEDEIEVFDPSGTSIETIANANEPCGLAVDTAGNLYVSERASGEVVRYEPPLYDERIAIDASGEAEGISVDRFDDRLYVAKGGRVDAYNSAGELGENEVQQLAIASSSGGTFRLALPGEGGAGRNEVQSIARSFVPYTLSFEGEETISLEANAPAAEVESALEELVALTPGDVSVVGFPNRTKWVEFEGALAETDVPLITSAEVSVTALSDITEPIAFEAPAGDVEDELELLEGIGLGNVSVQPQVGGYRFTFVSSLARTNVASLVGDPSGLVPSGAFNPEANATTVLQSFSGQIGEGELSQATGVAAYTYRIQSDARTRYLAVADADGDEVEIFTGTDVRNLEHRRTIVGVDADGNGEVSVAEEFQFGPAGTALAADPGNREGEGCAKVGNQACTAGHLLLYDAATQDIVELEATGEFLDRIEDPGLEDAEPTGLAIDRSGEAGDGTIYAGVGSGPGAEVLAFKPLVAPDRAHLPGLSQALGGAAAVATDAFGNSYVAAGTFVHIFGPAGAPVGSFEDPRSAFDLAVDSKCNVYVLDGIAGDETMTYYTPSSCPPTPATTYTRHEPPVSPDLPAGFQEAVAVNPADDHPFVVTSGTTAPTPILEFAAAEEGSGPVDECGTGLGLSSFRLDIDVYGANGHVFLGANPTTIYEIDCGEAGTTADDEILTRSRGPGCPDGQFGASPAIAVDQSNGHVLQFAPGQAGESAREYESSASCVTQFGAGVFSEPAGAPPYSIAIDNSGGPAEGTAYVAYDSNDDVAQPFDVNAFAPLSYGGPPTVTLGAPSGLGDAEATLHGSVDPNGFALEECRFEYLTDALHAENEAEAKPPFEGATQAPCEPGAGEIAPGEEPVPVAAEIAGLDPEARYRYRLLAENEFGPDVKEDLFGPPLITPKAALPVLYDEATLRGEVDPSGLATAYRFEYATDAYFQANGETYEHATPEIALGPGEGAVAVKRALSGLAEGTAYHFRLIAENEALLAQGPDRAFHTRKRTELREDCPNAPYRTGLSAKLPDCRAYELATPPNTGGARLYAGSTGSFDGYLAAPSGPEAGRSVGFFSRILPGLEGTGETDGYRSTRAPGAHPAQGWSTELAGPDYEQLGASPGDQKQGVGPDQRYWLWQVSPLEALPNTLAAGLNLRTPPGVANPACAGEGAASPQPEFELLGCASAGTDPAARALHLGNGDDRVIFSSKAALEPTAPPAGTAAIYSRLAGQASAEVLSLPPAGASPATLEDFDEEDAHFLAATPDGSAVAFEVAGTLYLRRGSETIPVSAGPHTFAGLSADGTRLFYTATTFPEVIPPPAALRVCDVGAGACPGGGLTEIAPAAVFVNVAAGGDDVLFASEEDLTGEEANEGGEEALPGEPNLYHWDAATVRFVAVLDPTDIVPAAFGETFHAHLLSWTAAAAGEIGGALPPVRSSPGGQAFLFLSHAQLTGYENTEPTAAACGDSKLAGEPCGQLFRYAPADPPGSRLLCLSCDPAAGPPTGEALLQDFFGGPAGATNQTTLIDNLTADGSTAFFETPDPILPEDANAVTDVYEWKALGAGEGSERCGDPAGCLALISSGQGEASSHLYGMTADGSDVFFFTADKLIGSDASGSSSIYDARVGGGIPEPPTPEPCQGDACQPLGGAPPSLPAPPSAAAVPDGDVRPAKAKKKKKPRCAKGKRKVKRKGKVRCVKRKAKRKQNRRHRRAIAARGTRR